MVKKSSLKSKIVSYLIASLWAATTIFPLIWVICNSFKSKSDIISNSLSLPKSIYLVNYAKVFTDSSVLISFRNSFIISGTVVIFTLLFGGLAAFAISRFNFKKASKYLLFFIFASMQIPMFTIAIPIFYLWSKTPINNTYFALIIPQVACSLPFSLLIISEFMRTIPVELDEAAIIDGCSIFRIFRSIITPITIPAYATTAIMTFLWSYNDLFLSMVFIRNRTLEPICVMLSKVSDAYGTNYGSLMAVIVITIMPVIALYMFSQNYVIKGLTAGSVKG